MVQNNNSTKNDNYKIRRFLLLAYNPCSNPQFRLKNLEEILTSGTKNIFDTSLLKLLNGDELEYYETTYHDFILVHEKALTNETYNPSSGGYEKSDNKQVIISRMNKINSTGMDIPFTDICSYIDVTVVETANEHNLVINTSNIDMIRYAYQRNTPFAFLLLKEYVDIYYQKGWKSLMNEVMKEINIKHDQ